MPWFASSISKVTRLMVIPIDSSISPSIGIGKVSRNAGTEIPSPMPEIARAFRKSSDTVSDTAHGPSVAAWRRRAGSAEFAGLVGVGIREF